VFLISLGGNLYTIWTEDDDIGLGEIWAIKAGSVASANTAILRMERENANDGLSGTLRI